MKKSTGTLPTPQIVAGIVATAAACLLISRRSGAIPSRQVVVITGGSRGLGLALAHRFGRAGARLVLAARDHEELDRARQALLGEASVGGSEGSVQDSKGSVQGSKGSVQGSVQSPDDILLVPTDITDQAEVQRLLDQAFAHFGRIDVLINNAGIIEVGPIENQSLVAFQRAMNTNFYGPLRTILAALPRLLAQPRINGRRASIVNISSIGGKVPVPHLLPYVASKFALTGLSEGLNAELRHKGIRVTTVCPGLMRTGSSIQAQFTGQAEKEFRWFSLGATTPGLAASTTTAANKIFNATRSGSAEITITPQAWLAARIIGLAPAASQAVASLANKYLLPAPAPSPSPLVHGSDIHSNSTPSRLEQAHNQI